MKIALLGRMNEMAYRQALKKYYNEHRTNEKSVILN